MSMEWNVAVSAGAGVLRLNPALQTLRVWITCACAFCQYADMMACSRRIATADRRRGGGDRERADCDEEKTEKVESRGCAGAGVFKYTNGDVYDGEWKDGNKHGRGTRGGGGQGCIVSGSVGG